MLAFYLFLTFLWFVLFEFERFDVLFVPLDSFVGLF